MLKSINPYNGNLIKEYNQLESEEIQGKVNNANDTFQSWKETTIDKRVDLLQNLETIMLKRKDGLAKLISEEMGKPLKESLAEIEKCGWVCRYYSENAINFLKNIYIPSDAYKSYVRYDPLGVILGIMPWNFPFWQVFRFLAPNISAGNVLLLKHASNVQGCAYAIEEIIREAGFPEGVFQNLCVSSKMISEVISNNCIKAVTLTGSERAGSAVAKLAGEKIKKTVLELGGSNSFIVMSGADINIAVQEGIMARMMNAGQSCIAAKRFFIHTSVYDEFLDLYVEKVKSLNIGNPLLTETSIGPLYSENGALEVERQVNQSVQMGAEIITGGERSGAFYTPTVLVNLTADMPVLKEEVFGPVAPIMPYKSIEEVVELSNSSAYGLGVTIFNKDISEAENLASLFDDGAVFINSLVKSDPRLPFGGTKMSGYGRELAIQGIMEFMNIKTVYIKK